MLNIGRAEYTCALEWGSDEIGSSGESDRGGAGRKIQLGQDVGDMTVDGVLADVELAGDLLIAEALGHQPENLHLPLREG
jgi:hypothetical protein